MADILGLNAQGALNYQLSLWNRVEGLDPSFLPRALQEDRSLVRSWFMRDTVHIVPTEDLPVFRRGLEEGLMREWNRWTVRTGRKEAPESWEPLYPHVLKALDGDALTINQMVEEVGWEGVDARPNLRRLVREMSLWGPHLQRRARAAAGDVGGEEDGVSGALHPRVRVSRRLHISLFFSIIGKSLT